MSRPSHISIPYLERGIEEFNKMIDEIEEGNKNLYRYMEQITDKSLTGDIKKRIKMNQDTILSYKDIVKIKEEKLHKMKQARFLNEIEAGNK